jgi:hypothetical protein
MRCTIKAMELFDVDEIAEVNFCDDDPGERNGVQVRFKDGTTKVYSGPELPEVLALLNHWTPPTA